MGMHHYGPRELRVGCGYKLQREPSNPYDCNAIAIQEQGITRAYLSRQSASKFIGIMNSGLITGSVYLKPKAILKILSVCCAPTEPPKSPQPNFFSAQSDFFFRGFRAVRLYAENRHQRRPRTSKIISVRPDSKGMSYIPISFRMINSCQNKYIKCNS